MVFSYKKQYYITSLRKQILKKRRVRIMKMRKIAAMGLSAVMAASMVPALPVMADDAAGKVYYLNFKPEQDEAWQNLAAKYTEETGVPVTVVTAASGQYETTLQSEMAKSDAPTLFQVNGPVGLKNWKDYCYDLSGTDIYSQLTSDSYTVKDGDAVDGIAYVIESYGLIVNKTLLEKAGYTVDDIKSFASVYEICYRKGGNLRDVINNTHSIISDKMEIMEEIETMVASNKMEQNLMIVMPVGLIGMIKMMSPDFGDNYATVSGVIATTLGVICFVASYYIGKKILDIKL